MTPQQAAAAEQFDRHMLETTGYTYGEYERVHDAGPSAPEHVQLYGQLVDESGAVDMLQQWDEEDRKASSGRKPLINFRATLTLYLMHTDGGNQRYWDVARTLSARLTDESFDYLDIKERNGSKDDWYHRYWRAVNRILRLTSPWEVPRNSFLTAIGYQRALEAYSQQRRDRMDQLMNALLHAAVRRLPADIRSTYKGNVAIDATLLAIAGRPNPGEKYNDRDRVNLDAMSGAYTRKGKHKGKGKRTDLAGWEAETVVTVPNAPGQPDSFPVLTTGLTLHQPGRIKHGPLIAIEHHTRLFEERGFIMADRAYNGLRADRFQNPTRKLGFRAVYKYKDNSTGKQGAIDDVILVDGCLYVRWMPEALATASHDYLFKKSIDRETYHKRLQKRTAYRLLEKGRPDADGYQRFTFPDLSKLMCIDPATGKRVKPELANRTFTLGPTNQASMTIIKSLQTFEYRSEKWYAWQGLRSHVESNNQYLKDDSHTDLGNPSKRRPRGYSSQGLAVAAAATVANIRRIVTFVTNKAKRVLEPKQLRARRRTDETGTRLEHLSPTEPPQQQ
ncbi:hypothetical protein [Glutamicibacter protophormiae]|uniref:hypothetical protein n=1 Tax=Glutamicibacter protophormiae TaxID=37930 RepID=UPI003A8CAE19